MQTAVDALRRAVKEAGGSTALADQITANGKAITRQAIEQWDICPPLRVLDVERVSGVPRHELRPDMYPEPARSESQPVEAAA